MHLVIYKEICGTTAGYFTSRATSKGWIREATAYLQAARQLEVLTGAAAPTDRTNAQSQGSANTDSLEEAVSLLQHHDAITGTEKQHVTDDYHVRLARGAVSFVCGPRIEPQLQNVQISKELSRSAHSSVEYELCNAAGCRAQAITGRSCASMYKE